MKKKITYWVKADDILQVAMDGNLSDEEFREYIIDKLGFARYFLNPTEKRSLKEELKSAWESEIWY